MTVDMIKEIKNRFPENPVWLLGMSWGSVLSAMAAKHVPELISGVIAFGQVLDKLMQNENTTKVKISNKISC